MIAARRVQSVTTAQENCWFQCAAVGRIEESLRTRRTRSGNRSCSENDVQLHKESLSRPTSLEVWSASTWVVTGDFTFDNNEADVETVDQAIMRLIETVTGGAQNIALKHNRSFAERCAVNSSFFVLCFLVFFFDLKFFWCVRTCVRSFVLEMVFDPKRISTSSGGVRRMICWLLIGLASTVGLSERTMWSVACESVLR